MPRYSTLIFIQLFFAASSLAQDSTRAKDSLPKFSFRNVAFAFDGGLIYQGGHSRRIILPEYFQQQPAPLPQYVGDEPLFHGAGYMRSSLNTRYNGFVLNASLTAEHRGQSYGVYNLQAIDVYPKFLVGVDTGFPLLGHHIGLAVSVGNYDNIRLQQGLMFYNMDIQGSRWVASIDRLKFTYQKIADLQYWIDLNQGDGNVYSVALDSISISNNVAVTAEYAFSIPTGVVPYQSSVLPHGLSDEESRSQSFSVRATSSLGVSLYGEYGLRNIQAEDNTAFLGGVSYHTNLPRFSLDAHAEYRYYGALFNHGFYHPTYSYTDTNGNTQYYTTTNQYGLGGGFLYPLPLYDRPFSQWAVFTDYQDLNVSGLTLYIDTKVPIYSGLFFKGVLDWNRIVAKGQSPFIYPFYAWGFGWQPFEGAYFLYGFTNRTMNLDRAYPTLYLFDSPTSELRAHWDLRF